MNRLTYLKVKDHSVSGEEFQLIFNEDTEMLETFPAPNEDQLSKYYKSEDYISHTDSKRNLFEHVYHLIRSRALKKKLRLINSFGNESKQLLDVGCGTGDFLKTALTNGWAVTGIEPNEQARKIANVKTNQNVFEIGHLANLKEHSFDVITLWHVLEHLPKLDTHIQLFRKLLKPNGLLIIAVPNYKSYDAAHYKEFWAAYDVPRHLRHFSRKSINKLFQKENFTLIKTIPLIFDAYYVSLLSEKYKTGYMNPLKAFWVGLKSNYRARHNNDYSSLIYVLKQTN
ncbi:class I SAM-dependent methyltransferase [Winogradskyella vincentii]|uniref:Class I SAM-dependent methyltransferase n=1 Tax=Winogradskyella vincentii TaxID=2877122 RepID=A0ABS7XXL3_9FLAO|nr:class I SAM-dependent methyltransferase [Winogradskyella vincentii]MCA0152394.1 class I SAM-dependent methyltransferase [Winogradskyella vincentii]